MTKGEIANFEQFLLLQQCFQKLYAAQASECVYMRERVNGNFLSTSAKIILRARHVHDLRVATKSNNMTVLQKT